MKMRRYLVAMLVCLLGLTLTACSDDPDSQNYSSSLALFEVSTSTFPMPNDLVWSNPDFQPLWDAKICTPGAVCIPPNPSAPPADPMEALIAAINNMALPGLSPNMYLTMPFSDPVDQATPEVLAVNLGDSKDIRMLNALAQDFSIDKEKDGLGNTTNTIKLIPTTPFAPGAQYAVVVRNAKTPSGGLFQPSATMLALMGDTPLGGAVAGLDTLRQNYTAILDGMEGSLFPMLGWQRDEVQLMWTFATAPVTFKTNPADGVISYDNIFGGIDEAGPFGAAGAKIASDAFPSDPAAIVWLNGLEGSPAAGPTPVAPPTPLPGVGAAYYGLYPSLKLPSFDDPDPVPPLDMVPFVIFVPDTGTAWDTVVFQHAITGQKLQPLAVASSLAQAGIATVSIDAIFHGERSLDGMPSGTGFFDLNMLSTRRNFFQAAIDLWELNDLLALGIDLGGLEGAELQGTQGYCTLSLGSIIGSVYLSQDDRASRVLLANSVGGLMSVLDGSNSPNVAPLIDALGLTRGTTEYYIFLNLAQWLLDPADGSYMKIGPRSTDNLLALIAFGDQTVPTSASRAFIGGLGLTETDIVSVVPSDIGDGLFPSPEAGAYEYGVADHPVTHDFLWTSDLFGDPRYADYIQEDQDNAHMGALMQAAGFFLLPPI